MTLQNAPHENIVEFLGTMNWNGNQLALVSLYVGEGTVLQYVKKNAGANRERLVSFIQARDAFAIQCFRFWILQMVYNTCTV